MYTLHIDNSYQTSKTTYICHISYWGLAESAVMTSCHGWNENIVVVLQYS